MQEYSRISSLSDAEVQYLDKQKIQDLVGGSIIVKLFKKLADKRSTYRKKEKERTANLK